MTTSCCRRNKKDKSKYSVNPSLKINKDFFDLDSIRCLCPQCYKEFKKLEINRIRKNIFATAMSASARFEEIKKMIKEDNGVDEDIAKAAVQVIERFYFSRFRR